MVIQVSIIAKYDRCKISNLGRANWILMIISNRNICNPFISTISFDRDNISNIELFSFIKLQANSPPGELANYFF